MLETRLRITNPLGLHARAAARLVRLTNTFASSISLRRDDKETSADAKSILSVLHLAAGFNIIVVITVDGPDEVTAMHAVEQLFVQGFGEI